MSKWIARGLCVCALLAGGGEAMAQQGLKGAIVGMNTECDLYFRAGTSNKYTLTNCSNPAAGIKLFNQSESLAKAMKTMNVVIKMREGEKLSCTVLSVDLLFSATTPNAKGPWGVLCEGGRID